jgi:hypothetical protein
MNDENVKREYTKEELAAISARMKAQITADDIVEIINGFSGPTTPVESLLKKVSDFMASNPVREGVSDGR